MSSDALTATVHRAWAADLDAPTLYALLRLRADVFVVEQACAYADPDGWDLEVGARHYWLGGDRAPEPILGCLRLLQDPAGEYRIGRVCTSQAARGRGLGRRLMEAALAEVGDDPCVLNAQVHVAAFYRAYGFTETGPAFDEDGIAHVPMRRDGR